MTEAESNKDKVLIDASDMLFCTSGSNKLGPVEASILEYVIAMHSKCVTRRCDLISLLIHAGLLARGARLNVDNKNASAVLTSSWASSDPIRLSYSLTSRPKSGTLADSSGQLQVSVAETNSQIFVNLTDTTTDKFGHLELNGPEHVRMDALTNNMLVNDSSSVSVTSQAVFPCLSDLVDRFEEALWKPVLPSPPVARVPEDKKGNSGSGQTPPPPPTASRGPDDLGPPRQPARPFYGDPTGGCGSPLVPDYGASDLNPFGGGLIGVGPRRGGRLGIGGGGGMLMDPRGPAFGIGGAPGLGGRDLLPPGAVPPGARFDPFGPGVPGGGPGRFATGTRPPDPDNPVPPGFDDMYL